ncbi:MAG: TlpA disulfide reductase family protein [Acidobacteriota bacterium]
MTKYLPFLLSLFLLTGCESTPTVAEDPCGRSPWVEQVYQQELALFESCGASATCLHLRQENIDVALAAAPDDLDLHQIYQFVRTSHGPDAEKRLVEQYKHRFERRGLAADHYLYARLLGRDHPQNVALLEEAARLDPALPRVHRALLGIYADAGDLASADRARGHYLELCPTQFSVYRQFADVFPSPAAWRPHLDAAGRVLRAPTSKDTYHRLPELWATELDLDPQNHRRTHGAIKDDLDAIASFDMRDGEPDDLIQWWRVQHEGFLLLGDEAGVKRALEERAKLEPCHPDVVNGRIAAWGEQNPIQVAPTPKNVAAWRSRKGQASEAWLQSCPTSWRYWGAYLDAAASNPEVADAEVLRRVNKARRAAGDFAQDLEPSVRQALATTVARVLHDRSLAVDVGQDWLSAEWQELGALPDGSLRLAALFPAEDDAPEDAGAKKLLPFELTDLDGRTRSSEDLRGKIVYVDVWSSSCIPCRNAMPKVQALHELTQQDDRFEVLTLSIDAAPRHAIALIRGNDYSFPVVIDGDYAEAMGVEALPTQWLVGGDLEILKDLTTAMIPYDDEWPGRILGLMRTLAASRGLGEPAR